MPSYVIDSENLRNQSNLKERTKNVFDVLNDKGEVIDTISLTYKEAHDEYGRYFVVEEGKYNLIQKYKLEK